MKFSIHQMAILPYASVITRASIQFACSFIYNVETFKLYKWKYLHVYNPIHLPLLHQIPF